MHRIAETLFSRTSDGFRNLFRDSKIAEISLFKYLKGTVSRDLRPSVFFSSNYTLWAPDSRAKSFLNSASNSPRYDRFSEAKIDEHFC
jgi:hypothetical protein